MAFPTPHEDGDAMREALAQHLALQHFTRVGMAPLFDWNHFAEQQRQSYRDDATKIMAGPLAQVFLALTAVTAERDEARKALERDRSIVATQINKAHAAIAGRAWLLEGGRGPYEWDDDRFREEFSAGLHEIEAPLEELRKIARDWTNCPTDQAEVNDARTDWKAALTAAQADNARFRSPFEHADGMDWDYLDSRLGQGGRDKFWRAVFAEFRAALQQEHPHA